jgi:hypothetical protein
MKYTRNISIAILSFLLFSCLNINKPIEQVKIDRVETMPNIPASYKMLDWKEKALDLDELLFNFENIGKFQPFIWLDDSRRNIDQTTFGLYTVIGDIRQGPNKNNGEFHEALNSLGALMGAGLVGIDKTNHKGKNYVKMVQNYFNTDNGWNIIMNNTCPEVALLGGGYGRDWWYDVYPNLLYYAVSDLFPNVENADKILKSIAEQFYKADKTLSGNYDYSYFDYSKMKGMKNQIPSQQDASAGHAYVLYCAYQKFGDQKYLEGAKSAIEALLAQKESRYYEVLMPFGALVAAQLNKNHGTNYDSKKILDWTFNGCKAKNGRTGWGVISDKWGPFEVHGLQGSSSDGGGYGFLMNTFDLAWPLVSLVNYEPKYARAVAKWLLNAANSVRYFYPYNINNKNQWLPNKKEITRNLIAYEGIRKFDPYHKKELKAVSPVALGDGPNWVVSQPELSMFSIYGSSHVGIFGAIINQTNVEKILQINCKAMDFYAKNKYPTYLYFNPYKQPKTIEYYKTSSENVDLYDLINKEYIAKNLKTNTQFKIEADKVRLLIEIPKGYDLSML